RPRRAEVEGGHVLDVVDVLLIPGLVEVELALEVRLDGRRHVLLGVPEGIAADLPHHHEGHEDARQDGRDRPDDSADDERGHLSECLPDWAQFATVKRNRKGGAGPGAPSLPAYREPP